MDNTGFFVFEDGFADIFWYMLTIQILKIAGI